jgi:holo-[acyl-carrier protein] synthase
MILGIGNDLVDIRRIEKALKSGGARFEDRIFTESEQKKARGRTKAGAKAVAATYAKRWAAKEACGKALGTGIRQWHDFEIINGKDGAPSISLSGLAKKRLSAMTPKGKKARVLLAMTDEYPFALAQVMIVADD